MTRRNAARTTLLAILAALVFAGPAHALTNPATPTRVATTPPTMYLSAVIRCTAGTWAALNDAGHTPYGVTSVTSSSTWVRVYHAPIGHVSSTQVTTDEAYVQDDVTVGASVALGYVQLHFAQHGAAVNPSTLCIPGSNVWVTSWEQP